MSMLNSLLNPKSVALIDCSFQGKFDQIFLKNMISGKYPGKIFSVSLKKNFKKFPYCTHFETLNEIKDPLDLVVIIPDKNIQVVIDECILNKTKNISILSNKQIDQRDILTDELIGKCRSHNINILGSNSLGFISTYNNINATILDIPLNKGKISLISESNSFCLIFEDWAKQNKIGISYIVSLGNKSHLSEIDFLKELGENDCYTEVIFIYIKAFKNGEEFLKIAKRIVKNKQIVLLCENQAQDMDEIYLSHTGKLIGNYKALKMVLRDNGIINVKSFREFFGFFELFNCLKSKNFQDELCVISNSNEINSLLIDVSLSNNLLLKPSSNELKNKLIKNLNIEESYVNNAFYIVNDNDLDYYDKFLRIICESKEYGNIIINIIPKQKTNVCGISKIIDKVNKEYKSINIFIVCFGGKKLEKGINYLRENNILCYDSFFSIFKYLSKLRRRNIYIEQIGRNFTLKEKNIPIGLKNEVKVDTFKKLVILPEKTTNDILNFFNINYPKNQLFKNKKEAIEYCQKIFPSPIVMKISSKEIISKTDLNGVYVGIDNLTKFGEAWESLWHIINKNKLKYSSILIQEMISKGTEIIIGINYDKRFGNILLFGSGGIYTEILRDTSIRLLPTNDFKGMINETKIGKIIKKKEQIDQLLGILSSIQDIIFSFPQIKSIDINPLILTNKTLIAVDVKMFIKQKIKKEDEGNTQYKDNYLIMTERAMEVFLTIDQNKLIKKWELKSDSEFIYVNILKKDFKVNRKSGKITTINNEDISFEESLSIFELLCHSKDNLPHASGKYATINNIKGTTPFGVNGDMDEYTAIVYDNNFEKFKKSCEMIGGKPINIGEIAYEFEVFWDLKMRLKFYKSDEEFKPKIIVLFDYNTLDYMSYESSFYLDLFLNDLILKNIEKL